MAQTDKKTIKSFGALVQEKKAFVGGLICKPQVQSFIKAVIPKHLNEQKMMEIFLNCYMTQPKLAHCTSLSMLRAFYNICQTGLEPNNWKEECYLIPYADNKNKIFNATFQLGYKGQVKLVKNTGLVEQVKAVNVFDGDEYKIYEGTDPHIDHIRAVPRDPSAEFCGCYGVIFPKGGGLAFFRFLDVGDVARARSKSKTAEYASSPWQWATDSMRLKTAINLTCKHADISNEVLSAAMSADYQGDEKLPQSDDRIKNFLAESDLGLNEDMEIEAQVEIEKEEEESKAGKMADEAKKKTTPIKVKTPAKPEKSPEKKAEAPPVAKTEPPTELPKPETESEPGAQNLKDDDVPMDFDTLTFELKDAFEEVGVLEGGIKINLRAFRMGDKDATMKDCREHLTTILARCADSPDFRSRYFDRPFIKGPVKKAESEPKTDKKAPKKAKTEPKKAKTAKKEENGSGESAEKQQLVDSLVAMLQIKDEIGADLQRRSEEIIKDATMFNMTEIQRVINEFIRLPFKSRPE